MSKFFKRVIRFKLLALFMFQFSGGDAFGFQDQAGVGTEPLGFTTVVEGYDWGAAVSKIILSFGEVQTRAEASDFAVTVQRGTHCAQLKAEEAFGARQVIRAYVSGPKGQHKSEGRHITLILSVGPHLPLSSPMSYFGKGPCTGNEWLEYDLTVLHKSTGMIWQDEIGRIMPLVDEFDLTGEYKSSDDLTMSYASFQPEGTGQKQPLIIWLHGGGEGGFDPSIALMANRAANYASPMIQKYFGGAFVLVPQCPGAWMHNTEGISTRGRDDDIYHEDLMALIKYFVQNNPDIDKDRIYVGGCSNGGYMSLKLILQDPDYFAAAFISALAYHSEYISDEQIAAIKEVPIWFIHAKDDPVTIAEKTVVPIYNRLIEADASDVHFSFYNHVIDLTGQYGGPDFHYLGHFSWIYSHVNHCTLEYDGSQVLEDGRPVTLMSWMASKRIN